MQIKSINSTKTTRNEQNETLYENHFPILPLRNNELKFLQPIHYSNEISFLPIPQMNPKDPKNCVPETSFLLLNQVIIQKM